MMPLSRTRKRLLAGSVLLAGILCLAYFAQVNLWVGGLWHGLPDTAASTPDGVLAAASLPDLLETATGAGSRPTSWATSMQGKGLGNFYRVSNSLYRGQQPTAEGFKTLKEMGVRTIVNLRWMHSDSKLIGDESFHYVEIEFDPFHPETEDVVAFLKVVNDPANGPVFVHCQHGSDRTGTMVAAYRMVVGGWSNQQALDEMVRGGYGFHEQWVNLAEFVRRLDAKELRRRMEQPKE